jgi:hypothetical protein
MRTLYDIINSEIDHPDNPARSDRRFYVSIFPDMRDVSAQECPAVLSILKDYLQLTGENPSRFRIRPVSACSNGYYLVFSRGISHIEFFVGSNHLKVPTIRVCRYGSLQEFLVENGMTTNSM